MKKKILMVASFVFATTLFTISGFGISNVNSLEELKSEAGSYCSPCSCASDCVSSATGNIYAGYVAESF